MNERIKELVFKAYNNTGSVTPSVLSSFMEVYSEKFAELIIEKFAYDLMDAHAASPEHISFVAKQYGVEL